MTRIRRFAAAAAAVMPALVIVSSSADARADDKECMSAAAKGQEARDQGHFVEARPLFQRCAQSSCPAPIPKYCADWLADLTKKLPSIVLRAEDDGRDVTPEATASLDEQSITLDGRAMELDPGKHHLRITRKGSKPYEAHVVVAQSEKDRVIVAKLERDGGAGAGVASATAPIVPRPQDDRSRPVPVASWIGWGVGAVGLVSFSIFGLKARMDYDDFDSSCGQRCTNANRDSVQTSVTLADISLVVGLIGAGVGTYFYLTRPRR